MKVELGFTWPLYGQFYDLARGKSGAAPYILSLSPVLAKSSAAEGKAPELPAELKKALEGMEKEPIEQGAPLEVRGIIMHKFFLLARHKEVRTSILEFFITIINNDVYPKVWLILSHMIQANPYTPGFEQRLVGLCFGLGEVSYKSTITPAKECFAKLNPSLSFPGASPVEIAILEAKESSVIVPFFLQTYRLPVSFMYTNFRCF